MHAVRRFFRDESGATAIEYGLIAGAIALVIVPILGSIGGKLMRKLNPISNALGPSGMGGG